MDASYFVQQWFDLSDPGVEEALYDSASTIRTLRDQITVAPRLRHSTCDMYS